MDNAVREYLEMLRIPHPRFSPEAQEIINNYQREVLESAQERIKEQFDYAMAHPGELVPDLTGGYFMFEPKKGKQEDRKHAFLMELKALLEKYDASFSDSDDYRIYASIDDSTNGPGFYWEMNEQNGYQLNADSIMGCKDD